MTTLRDQLAQAIHTAQCGPDCDDWQTDPLYAHTADAVLALLDVHEQWRTHITAPLDVKGIWLPLPIPEGGGAIPAHATGHVEHRWVLTTKPEPVERHRDAEELTR